MMLACARFWILGFIVGVMLAFPVVTESRQKTQQQAELALQDTQPTYHISQQ
jgi:hypothetical protein